MIKKRNYAEKSWGPGSPMEDIQPKKERDHTAKSDQGKTDWSLLPWRSIEKAAEIMTLAITPKDQGGEGYARDSWRTVPGGFWRYWAAMNRHIIRRYIYNEVIDPKSKKPHMSHVICNAAFVCEMDLDHKTNVLSAIERMQILCDPSKKELLQVDEEANTFYTRDI
jgi:hypothetical protein